MVQTLNQSGFVAGTLVHTDQGLVAIEQLSVGDRVLSKAEDDLDGELIYQQIKKTHGFEHKSLYMLHVVEQLSDNTESEISQVFTTPNHPFWKVNVGWVRADLLRNNDEILLNNGRKAYVFGGSPVLKTQKLAGSLEILSNYAADDLTGVQFSDWAYSDTVYNIEVEDTPYFVSKAGIWVKANN